MAWIPPEHKLDPQQREYLDKKEYNQFNSWIKGFPGSGKSVLLAYTLKEIKTRTPSPSVVVVVFTRSLVQMFSEAFKEMGISVPVQTFYQFMNSNTHYDYVLCDEVQDLVPSVLREMRRKASHVVVSGDENQSIYERDPKYNEATISSSEISQLLSTHSFKLNIIHRLSSSIISVINRFLPNLDIFAATRDLTHEDTQVRMCEAYNLNEEVKYIMREGIKASNVGETAVVLLPTRNDVLKFANLALTSDNKPEWTQKLNKYGKLDFRSLNLHLHNNSINLKYVGNGIGEFENSNGKVILMTYHSSKGLDFDNVFLPFLNSSLFIVPKESLSKTLFMVAMTRSRNNLYLTYTGYKHFYLELFSDECNEINIHDALNANAAIKTNNNENPFGI